MAKADAAIEKTFTGESTSSGSGRVAGARAGGDGESWRFELHDLSAIIDTKVAASEDRIMRQVAEKTAKLEVDLTMQMTSLATQVNGITKTVIISAITAVIGAAGLYIAINQLVFDGQSTSFSIGALVERQNAEVRGKIDENARQISELVAAMKGLQDAKPSPSSETPKAP